jgi:hypothetical protein
MPEFLRPPPHEYGPPPVYLAAVGERMTEVAGGRARSEVDLEPVEVRGPVLIAAGRTGTELDAAVSFSAPYPHDRAVWREVITELALISDARSRGDARPPRGS